MGDSPRQACARRRDWVTAAKSPCLPRPLAAPYRRLDGLCAVWRWQKRACAQGDRPQMRVESETRNFPRRAARRRVSLGLFSLPSLTKTSLLPSSLFLSIHPSPPQARDKLAALAAVFARFLLSPALLLRSLLTAPDMVVWNEPCGYRSPGWRQWATTAGASSASSLRRSSARAIAATVGRAVALEHAVEADVRLVLRRFWESGRTSAMLTLQAALYYSALHILWFFGLHHLIFHFKHDLEWAVCAASGTFHRTARGEKVQYTLLSAMDPEYPTPYGPGAFPWGPALDDARNAHFLSLACKVVYEDERIVRDLVEEVWGLKLLHYARVPAHWTAEYWVPDLVWFAARVPASGAVILAFKGADPLWQVSLKADPPISKRERTGLVGQVHCGLWRGLKQAAPGAPAGTSIWDTIVSVLRRVPPGPGGRPAPVWLAGHSLGGGLAALTAALLASRCPDLAPRLAAVFTYAAPRFGDATFAASFDATFAGRAFRYVNASDMVCKLPPGWGYAHPAAERFISSVPVRPGTTAAAARSASGRILRAEDDPAGVAAAAVREDRWGYWYSLRKLWAGGAEGGVVVEAADGGGSGGASTSSSSSAALARRAPSVPTPLVPPERATRRVARALLFAMPGFSDHFLCDYERALREELPAAMAADAARAAAARAGASTAASGRPLAPVATGVEAAAAAASAVRHRRCSAETEPACAPSSPFAVVQVAASGEVGGGGKDAGGGAVPAVDVTAVAVAGGGGAAATILSPGRPPRAPRHSHDE
jgi:hypothetical protein